MNAVFASGNVSMDIGVLYVGWHVGIAMRSYRIIERLFTESGGYRKYVFRFQD